MSNSIQNRQDSENKKPGQNIEKTNRGVNLTSEKNRDGKTGRKNAETLFRESERRRLLAFEATSDGIWEWNIQTGEIITSPSYFTMLGCTSSDLDMSYPEFVTSYDEFINVLHSDDRETVDKSLHACITGQKNMCEIELRMRTKSGGWKWILKRGKVVEWDEQGKPLRMIGTHIDINERKLAKEALKQTQERIRAQYIGMPIPTYTWQKVDDDIILIDYNTAAVEFTNGMIPDFIGKKACTLYQENKEIYNNILKAYHNKAIYKFETIYHMFTTKDIKYITITCAYVAPDMVLVHMEDITKQKLAEKQLQCSEKNLRNLTEQLFKAEENANRYIAQELHDSIGQYLSSIKYITEKAVNQLQAGNPEEGRLSLETIISIVQTTIDEVSRISMGLRPSILDDLGILSTINWFCREYQHVYPNICIEKSIGIEEGAIPLKLKTPLFRILQESLNNVARHSQATRVRVALVKAGAMIELSIADNGSGFNIQDKIPNDQNGHKGFGLISMEERTKYSGGVFAIESSRKKGTIIRVSWPCQ